MSSPETITSISVRSGRSGPIRRTLLNVIPPLSSRRARVTPGLGVRVTPSARSRTSTPPEAVPSGPRSRPPTSRSSQVPRPITAIPFTVRVRSPLDVETDWREAMPRGCRKPIPGRYRSCSSGVGGAKTGRSAGREGAAGAPKIHDGGTSAAAAAVAAPPRNWRRDRPCSHTRCQSAIEGSSCSLLRRLAQAPGAGRIGSSSSRRWLAKRSSADIAQLPEPPKRSRDPRLHRPGPAAEEPRDLSFRKVEVVAQDNRLPGTGGKRLERGDRGGAQLLLVKLVLSSLHLARAPGELTAPVRPPGLYPGRPYHVSMQPAGERHVVVHPWQRAKRIEERLLLGVLGRRA